MTNWRLSFADEFSGNALDMSIWDSKFYDGLRTGWPPDGSTELQYYLDRNVILDNDCLRLRAVKEDYVAGRTWTWTSGMVQSALRFYQLFGRFEARIRMPQGVNGFWPAFWLCANPDPHVWPPEIDIMEQFSLDNGYYATWDYPNPPGTPNFVGFSMIPVADIQNWHVYGVDWTADAITFTCDGVAVHTTSDHVNTIYPMYILLNLAVDAGSLNPPHHAPDANTPAVAYMDVDWVRVYAVGRAAAARSVSARVAAIGRGAAANRVVR